MPISTLTSLGNSQEAILPSQWHPCGARTGWDMASEWGKSAGAGLSFHTAAQSKWVFFKEFYLFLSYFFFWKAERHRKSIHWNCSRTFLHIHCVLPQKSLSLLSEPGVQAAIFLQTWELCSPITGRVLPSPSASCPSAAPACVRAPRSHCQNQEMTIEKLQRASVSIISVHVAAHRMQGPYIFRYSVL